MRTSQLALSRSAIDRDAERRSEPGLLDRLAADPDTRLLLVDARGLRAARTPPAFSQNASPLAPAAAQSHIHLLLVWARPCAP